MLLLLVMTEYQGLNEQYYFKQLENQSKETTHWFSFIGQQAVQDIAA